MLSLHTVSNFHAYTDLPNLLEVKCIRGQYWKNIMYRDCTDWLGAHLIQSLEDKIYHHSILLLQVRLEAGC